MATVGQRVQEYVAGNAVDAVASLSLTGVTAGNFLWAMTFKSSAQVTSITGGGTWVHVGGVHDTTNLEWLDLFYCNSATGGGTATPSASVQLIRVYEVQGPCTFHDGKIQWNNPGGANPQPGGGAAATSLADSVFGGMVDSQGSFGTRTAGGSFTKDSDEAALVGTGEATEHQYGVSAGTLDATWTAGGGANRIYVACTISVTPAAGGAAIIQAAQAFPPFSTPFIEPNVVPFQLLGDRSGQQSVNLADTAAGADAVTVAAAVPLADAGAGDDSGFTVAAAVPLSDSGAATETLSVLVDWGQVAPVLPFPPFSAPFIEPNVVPFQLQGDSTGVTAVSLTDSGAGSDSITETATVPLADTGAGADAVSLTATVPLSDAGAGDDSGFTVAAAVPLTDTGAGSETLSVLVDYGQVAPLLPFPPFSAPFVEPNVVPFQLMGDASGSASFTLNDTGAGSDAVTVAAAVPLTDTGTGSDAITVAVSVPLTDSGAGDDSSLTVTAAVPLADSGAAADSITVNTGSDSNQAPLFLAPMFLEPNLAAFQLAGDASGSAQISLTDSGTETETLAVTAAVPLSDTGAGSDALTSTAAVPLSDSGAGADATTIAAAVPLTEAGAGSDAVTVAAAVPLSDSGSGSDSITVVITTDYTAGPSPFPPFAAPFISPRPVPFQLAGDASGSNQVSLTDSGAGSDGITVSATLTVNDTGAGADSLTVAVPVSLADSGTATDSLSVVVTVHISDTGSGSDVLSVNTNAGRYPVTDGGHSAAPAPMSSSASGLRPVTSSHTGSPPGVTSSSSSARPVTSSNDSTVYPVTDAGSTGI